MKRTHLLGWNIQAGKESEPGTDDDGNPIIVDAYYIAYQEHNSGDIIHIAFTEEVRDVIVRQLTGGIILAGGNLPKLPPK